jgi:hypothetical protein
MYQFESYELKGLLADAVEIGYKKALVETGQIKTFLSQRQAFRLYGETTVKRWIAAHLIEPDQDGSNTSKKRYDRMQLEILAKSSNRDSYMTKEEVMLKRALNQNGIESTKLAKTTK